MIYGVNTGFGGSADVRSKDSEELQKALVRHLNAGFGSVLPSYLVKSVMAIRANSLSIGQSGVRQSTVQHLVDMFNSDIVPEVPKRGSVSASGDLMPTSYIASAMMGRKDSYVTVQGRRMTSQEALKHCGLAPVVFQTKEALAVVNSASFAAALAAHVIFDANFGLVLTQLATALTCECLEGRMESFHPLIHEKMAHPGQKEAAQNILHLLSGSKLSKDFNEPEADESRSLKQDRYALRSAPQWLGPVLETALESVRRVTTELNSVNDNPIIDHKNNTILHGANFQGTSVTVAMDQLRQSIQLCGKLLFGQMQEIVNHTMNNGLPPNLSGADVNTDFGFKGMDTAMASYMSELDYVTQPLTNHVLSAEMHNQAVNSMALVSARYTQEALQILQMMLANIFCAHAQAIDLRILQKMTENMLGKIFSDFDLVFSKPLQNYFPWYNFAFRPQDTATEVLEHFQLDQKQRVQFVYIVERDMNELMTSFKRGRHVETVEEHLGQGKAPF